jgi:hypothetical protein
MLPTIQQQSALELQMPCTSHPLNKEKPHNSALLLSQLDCYNINHCTLTFHQEFKAMKFASCSLQAYNSWNKK